MTDRNRVVGYVDEERKQEIERAADDADQSVSQWVGDAAREKLEREQLDNLIDQYRIEQRLLEMVDRAADRASDRIVEDLAEHLNAVDGDRDDLDQEGERDDYDNWGEEQSTTEQPTEQIPTETTPTDSETTWLGMLTSWFRRGD